MQIAITNRGSKVKFPLQKSIFAKISYFYFAIKQKVSVIFITETFLKQRAKDVICNYCPYAPNVHNALFYKQM